VWLEVSRGRCVWLPCPRPASTPPDARCSSSRIRRLMADPWVWTQTQVGVEGEEKWITVFCRDQVCKLASMQVYKSRRRHTKLCEGMVRCRQAVAGGGGAGRVCAACRSDAGHLSCWLQVCCTRWGQSLVEASLRVGELRLRPPPRPSIGRSWSAN
jgi:hypothetical protein